MDNATEKTSEVIKRFWAYRPYLDKSPPSTAHDLYEAFSYNGRQVDTASVSTFATVVTCPYRVVNAGAGYRPVFSKRTIAEMQKGAEAHRIAAAEIMMTSEAAKAGGGPPDWVSAPATTASIASEDLLEAPEVRVQLAVEGLRLRGVADGVFRSKGIVSTIERKPLTAMCKPSSVLQAMTYAIGACLSLNDHKASVGAGWATTSYSGKLGRGGRITQEVCVLIKKLGAAYLNLIHIGTQGESIPDLPGPAPRKCGRCEYFSNCRHSVQFDPQRPGSRQEPIWVKYAKRKE